MTDFNCRRDKNLNMFNIMVRKRIKKEDEADEEDSKEKVKNNIKSKGLVMPYNLY